MKLAFDGHYILLKEIATPNARIGWQNLRSEEFSDNGDAYIITGTDFRNGKVDFSTCMFVSNDRYLMDKRIQVNDGDILITKDGTIGKVAFVEGLNDKKATLNAGVFILNNIDSKVVDRRYLFHYLNSPLLMKFVRSNSTGGTIQHLNQNVLVNFPIKLPTLEIQKLIGNFLFAIDEKIALAERKNLKLNELKECLLNQIISTQDRPMVELGSLANIKDGARVPNEYWKSEGIPYIRAKDLNDGMANVELYLTHEKYEEYRSKTGAPVSGDLIFVTGGNIGLSMFKSDNSPLYVQGGAILTVKTSESKLLDGKFLHYYLQTNACKRYIETHSVGGTIKHFTVAPSLKLPIPLIPIDEQIKIASFFSKLDEKISFSKAKLDMLRRLKQALLQQMFV